MIQRTTIMLMLVRLAMWLIACTIAWTVSATVRMTPEGKVMVQTSVAMRLFVLEHPKQRPKSWADLKPYINVTSLNEQVLTRSPLNPIEHRLYFLAEPIPIPDKPDAQAHLITLIPTEQEGRGEGRWIIYGNTNGFFREWLPEARAQTMLEQARVTLPAPPNVPRVFSEADDLLEKAAHQATRELRAQLRAERQRQQAEAATSGKQPTHSTGSSAPAPTLAETGPESSSAPWPAIAVVVLTGGLLIFLLWRGSRFKAKDS